MKNIFFLTATLFLLVSCNTKAKSSPKEEVSGYDNQVVSKSDYNKIKKQVMTEPESNFEDSANIFDNGKYVPEADTLDRLLVSLGRVYKEDSNMIVKFDIRTPEELAGAEPEDTLVVGNETFTRNLHDITESEIKSLKYNLTMVKYVHDNKELSGCVRTDCPVYAHVSKKKQLLFLYVNGELLDSFKCSTGNSSHVTPDFDTKPDGRMFKKYTSHKFPGGNWNGLGNMPYAVFIKGGYAIHGTTIGSIPHLGHPASHGCIRLHPKNGKIFYNLCKFAGKENVWITVDDKG